MSEPTPLNVNGANPLDVILAAMAADQAADAGTRRWAERLRHADAPSAAPRNEPAAGGNHTPGGAT